MRRREFITLFGGAAAWPFTARAQQREQVRRVGVLLPATAGDSEYSILTNAFMEELRHLGWAQGRNIRIDTHWAGGDPEGNRKHAEELKTLAPDVIVAAGNASAGPLLQVTRTIPIVFTIVPDPVGAGLVDNLARPTGNATGFTSFAYDIGSKWLGLLKRGRTAGDASSSPPGFRDDRWSWSVERHSNCGTVIRTRGHAYKLEQSQRARTRHFRICAVPKWGPDCNVELIVDRFS